MAKILNSQDWMEFCIYECLFWPSFIVTKAERKQRRLYQEFKNYVSGGALLVKPATPATENLEKSRMFFSLQSGAKWKVGAFASKSR